MNPRRKVLIMDDDPVVQQLLRKLVESRGAEAVVAANGQEINAILVNGALDYDLFLLDLILPSITGWDILQTLRDKPQTKGKPIIVLTGAVLSGKEREKMLRQVNAVIEKKDFTMREFDRLLDEWLSDAAGEA
ncbi:MAG: response regulator [Lentisphaerae bacterium]|nr:response regulator [Lentisphaerota bacterium]